MKADWNVLNFPELLSRYCQVIPLQVDHRRLPLPVLILYNGENLHEPSFPCPLKKDTPRRRFLVREGQIWYLKGDTTFLGD